MTRDPPCGALPAASPNAELPFHLVSYTNELTTSAHGILSMPLLSKKSRIDLLPPAKWVALVLPLAITAGCAGFQNRDIIDYTMTEAEYLAATAPPETQEVIASIELPAEPLPVVNEPVMAAAKPAPAEPAVPSIAAAEAMAVAALQPIPAAEPELAKALPPIDYDSLSFSPSVYATAGLGISRMNPDTSAAAGWTADDKIANAGQAAIGVDIAKRLSVELHSADYGSTGLAPEGRVNFHVHGISALIYANKNDRYRRRGWNGYARLGFNMVENTPVGNIPFADQSSTHASFGVGAEYNTRFGLGFRADAVAYDGDVQFGQLGVLYRMAKKPKRPALAMVPELPAQPVMEAPALPELEAAMPAPIAAEPASSTPALTSETRQDEDIMLPRLTTQAPAQVTAADECAGLNGTLNNVSFLNGSAALTQGAAIALNNIARTLNGCQEQEIVISAHTDSTGSAHSNNHLAKIRARSVAMHLARQGVSMNRMRAVAYGESRPIASNATVDGRMRNRRVELEVR